MLGLGNSVGASQYNYDSAWTPETLSNLQLWLAFNTNITSDQEGGSPFASHDHSTAAGNMADNDKVNAWNAAGSTSINITQTEQSKKPVWDIDNAADVGGVYFAGSKLMALSSDVVLDANTDFTIAIRIKAVGISGSAYNKAFMGSTATEFIRFSNNTTIRVKINGTNRDFALASGTIAADEYFTLLIVRSDGSTGNVNMFVRGNESLDGTATGTQMGSELQDAGEITIDEIGGVGDGTGQSNAFIKDVLIWDGTAASSGDREQIFDYIEGQ
jgi:hypothetical protein